ncbi:MAG TPA: hypothetical protein VE136_17050 [Anaerolineales bacterium]|jgi:hypothetical protein|nr:hypothetical protein [Anaerolineales bacterium]
MITFSIYCDASPGKEEELDRFLTGTMKNYWANQSGVKEYHTLRDKLVGYPERTVRIELTDFATLQKILDSGEWINHRRKFMSLLARVQSQILEPLS